MKHPRFLVCLLFSVLVSIAGAVHAFGPPCGALDQSPCPGNKCAPGLFIRDGKCRVPCGGLDQPCCPGNACLRLDTSCRNGKCQAMDWGRSIEEIKNATVQGINLWKNSLRIGNVKVNGTIATFVPGSFMGMPIPALIISSYAPTAITPPHFRMAFANATGAAVEEWFKTYMFSAPLYPTFHAVPSPFAPATPAKPFHLGAGTSAAAANVSASMLAPRIKRNLGNVDPTLSGNVDDYARWFEGRFSGFRNVATVYNLIGTGPVPTFAPPYVNSGPVVGGNATCNSNCLAGNF